MEGRAATQPGPGVPPLAVVAAAGALVLLAVLLVVCAVSPAGGVFASPLLVVGAVAVARRATAVRVGLAAGAVGSALGLAVLAAAEPAAAVAVAPAAVLAAGAWTFRRALVAPLVAAGSVLVCVTLVAEAALWPGTALLVALVVTGAVAAVVLRGRIALAPRAVARQAALPAGAAVCGGTVALAIWPTTTVLALIALAGAVLVWRAPAAALALGILMAGFEGTIKILLDVEPLPIGHRAAGAGAVDFVLFAGTAAVILSDRLRTPRLIWARTTRLERIALGALGLWVVASVLQTVQSGNLVRGLEGFRLFQAYAFVAVAATIVAARSGGTERAARVLLVIALAVSAYAALRVVIGPTDAEREAASSSGTVISYGGTLRAIGSFSSAVGLASYLAPVGALGLVTGYLHPPLRRLAWVVAALALVGLLGSYSRSSLVGLGLGLLCALALLAAAADVPRRRKLVAAGLVLATLAVTYAGARVASQASPVLEERASGLLNPFSDESVNLRFDTWGRTVRSVPDRPMGRGLGTAGAASGKTRGELVTTDNSFLKVVWEQGVLVALVFLVGLIGTVVLVARRLRDAAGENRALGLAALSAFIAFLGISLTGEYVEQPGKVIAWALLGVAAAASFARPTADAEKRA